MTSSGPPPESSLPRKPTLYCFSCGHESLIDGDWIVREHDACVDYECPECGTTITSRPRIADGAARSERIPRCCPGD